MKKRKRQTWVDKYISVNQIVTESPSGRAVLIALPEHSAFAGWKFWHPKSLVRYGCPFTAILCGSDMTFTLEKGKEEVKLSADQFMRVETCGPRNPESAKP